MKRYHNLDYLRGLAAFGVMAYHFNVFAGQQLGVFLSRVGLYAVSLFYILSGLTLALVYQHRFAVRAFFIKRFFRIYPLLILVTLLTIALQKQLPDLKTLLLNLTGLFGFVDWSATIATGTWSIGNELTFYAWFPLLLFTSTNRLFVAALLLTLLFSFVLLSPSQDLVTQWHTYVNPLNQLPYFIAGMLIARVNKPMPYAPLLLLAGLLLFVFFPTGTQRAELVSGGTRFVFFAAVILVCLGVYKTTFHLPALVHTPLVALGALSYSLYLLHPLVWNGLDIVRNKTGLGITPALFNLLAMLLSIAASYISYHSLERYFMQRGTLLQKERAV